MVLSFLGNINSDWQNLLYYGSIVVVVLIYFGVITTLLIENRDPVKSLAYIMIFLLLPGVGLIVYFLIGRDHRKQKKFTLKGSRDLMRLREFIDVYKEYFIHVRQELENKFGDKSFISDLFLYTKQSILTENNDVSILENGEEKYKKLLEDINNATHHIHIEYYIFDHDETGMEIAKALVEKASEGVLVRFIYDDFGSNNIGDIPELLENGNVEVIPFDPLWMKLYTNANYRNHRKIVVIDGTIGYVGGINVSNKYDNTKKNSVFWRDTHIRIEGNAVNLLQMQFLLSYKYASGELTFPIEFPYFNYNQNKGDAFIDIVGSGPDSNEPYNMLGIISAINTAKSEINITNPYFIPNAQIITALEVASLSGKKVKLIVPKEADSKFVQFAMNSYMKKMLEVGVEVYVYKKGFIHAKTITVDDDISIVGTVNFDNRSFFINFEIAAFVYDKKVNSGLRELFENDMEDCDKLILSEWQKRPIGTKFMESLCRLLTPLL